MAKGAFGGGPGAWTGVGPSADMTGEARDRDAARAHGATTLSDLRVRAAELDSRSRLSA